MQRKTRKLDIPAWLFIIITMLLINGLVTGLHFILIFLGVIPIKGNMGSVIEIALGDFIVSVIPSFAAAVGLWLRKTWGWVLSFVIAGSYLHGQFVLLGRFYMQGKLGSMSAVSVYFIVFNAMMIFWLWRHRAMFLVRET